MVGLYVGHLCEKWHLEYQMVTKTYLHSNLCDSSDSSYSCDSIDSSYSRENSDSSDSSDSCDSCESSDQKTLYAKKLKN